MPDIKKVKLRLIISYYREAIRELAGYMPGVDDGVERKAILNKDKTHLNRLCIDRDCLHAEKGSWNQTAKVKAYYKERYGKNPKSNAVAIGLFMALPRDYVANQFTDEEYNVLLAEMYGETDIDKKVLERAHEKILNRTYSEEELEKIYDYFEKSVPVVCKAFGIKESDILYFALHLEESFPHIQCILLSGVYIADQEAWQEYCNREEKGKRPRTLLGDTNRIIGAEEEPVGCSVERIDKLFLKQLNKYLEDGFKELGIEAHIANGKGQINDVQTTGKEQRKAAAIARGVEEEAKRRAGLYEAQIAIQEKQITNNEETIKAQEVRLKDNAETIKDLQQEIKSARTELKGLKKAIRTAKGILSDIGDRIGGLIQTGIAKIRRAKSRRDRDDAAKEAEEQLIRIKTDAEAVMNAFMPFDDDEVAGPEEEYDEERDDI